MELMIFQNFDIKDYLYTSFSDNNTEYKTYLFPVGVISSISKEAPRASVSGISQYQVW